MLDCELVYWLERVQMLSATLEGIRMIFSLLFTWALASSGASQPQVLLLSACTLTACSTQASGLLWERIGTGGPSARLLWFSRVSSQTGLSSFQSSVHL